MLALIFSFPACAEMDYILEVYGNANMDRTINQEDIILLKAMIEGSEGPTRLADANYDGDIDERDIDLVQLILEGKEQEITIKGDTPATGHS